MTKTLLKSLGILVVSVVAGGVFADLNTPENRPSRIRRADMVLAEFEKEVSRAGGGENQRWINKEDALSRVAELYREAPEDPAVQALFARARAVLMKSNGRLSAVDASWTLYKRNEENLRQFVWSESQKVWNDLLARGDVLGNPFPAPDYRQTPLDDIKGKLVVLDVRYPANQFYGGTGEYVFSGSPSQGFWFVRLGTRAWVAPYEAIKRYRDEVDSSLADVASWKVLGRIADITAEFPDANEQKLGGVQFGWVVEPVALMVDGHVVSVYQAEAPRGALFAGETEVEKKKAAWYTVKSVPADVTPVRLAEIFMTAIKEKNFDLYLDCIDPRYRTGANAYDRKDEQAGGQTLAYADLRYHWQLHQERFHNEYVHATFKASGPVTVVSGFDSGDKWNDLFLDDDQKSALSKAKGELVEHVKVESMAIDANGRQLGSPHPRTLVRRDHGRWYVLEYAPRF